MKIFKLNLCFIFLSYFCVKAVDRSNFKTCDQSGFCKQIRNMEKGNSQYQLLLDTLHIQKDNLQVDLLNKKNNVKFILKLSGIKDNVFRLRITEKEPLKPRYEPEIGDVLNSEPIPESITVKREGQTVKIDLKNDAVVILDESPFSMQVLQNGEPVLLVNSRGLLRFEHTRTKPEAEPPQPADDDAPADENAEKEDHEKESKEEGEKKESDEEGVWEESFKGHTDTKPSGPQAISLDFSFPGFEHVYGIPEHADSFALKSTRDTDPYRLYNLDVFEYELDNPMALYGSIPLMYAHNDKRTIGLFWLNTAETWVDIGSNTADKNVLSKLATFVGVGSSDKMPQVDTHWMSESGIIDVFFLLGPKPNDAFRQYASLTGTTPLPPLFAIAYHQCRWNYNDEEDVQNVNEGFDTHDIPMDVIWLDIEHTDGKRYFTWDGAKFSHSVDMINKVAARGRKMVTIVDPHLKRDDNYHVHSDCRSKGFYIKNKDGNDYDGWCWPGSSSWPDYFKPEVREWWAGKFLTSEYTGSTTDLFTWNDMNEPSVFNGPEITMHKDAKHLDGHEHRHVHNLYGTLVHRATFEGHLKRDPNQRPFILSRAFFAGSQRYGAVWTGDNMSEWGHLKISMPMLLSHGVTGISFIGADVGGFFKNPDAELLTRWYQAGAYQPFFRAHAHLDTKRREPWLFPEANKNIIRDVIRARYALLPFWYTLFHFGEKEGGPVMKPLWVDFPQQKETFSIDDQYLVGSALLVKPITEPGATGTRVFFPGDSTTFWYNIYNKQPVATHSGYEYVSANLDTIPVFQRGGTIIPRKNRIRRASLLAKEDPYTLTIALDQNASAEGDLYIDDYMTHEYKQKKYSLRKFVFANNKLTNKNADPTSNFETKSWLEKVEILGMNTKPRSVQVIGEDKSTRDLEFSFEPSTKVLTIRKPDVNIAQDWIISLNR